MDQRLDGLLPAPSGLELLDPDVHLGVLPAHAEVSADPVAAGVR